MRFAHAFAFPSGQQGAASGGGGAVAGDPIAAEIRGATWPTNSAQYPNGWTMDVTFKGNGLGTNTPDPTKIVVNVVSPGYVAGALGTISRTITAARGLRLVLPNDALFLTSVATDTVVTFALNGRIHPGDTITSVVVTGGAYGASNTKTLSGAQITNSSTLAYEKAVGKFVSPQNLEAPSGSSTFVAEFAGTHWAARNGQQFCCVDWIATDETGNTTTGTCSTPAISTTITNNNVRGVYSEVWPLPVALAGLNQGENVTVRAKVKPWVGDATAILDSDPTADGIAYLSSGWSQLASLTFFNNKTGAYGQAFAYVDPVSGIALGTASTVALTARAVPFDTIQHAAAAIQTFNNVNFSRNNHGNGRIRLMDTGQHVSYGATMNGVVAGKTWLTIEDDPMNAGQVIFTSAIGSAATTSTKIACDLLRFSGRITMQPPDTVAGSQTMTYSGTAGGNNKRLLIDGINITGNAQNVPVIYGFQWKFARNMTITSLGGQFLSFGGVNVENWVLLSGVYQVSGNCGDTKLCNTIGSVFNGARVKTDVQASREPSDKFLIMSSIFFKCSLAVVIGDTVDITGCAIDTILIENISASGVPSFQFGADGTLFNIANSTISHSYFAGERCNRWYCEEDNSINALKTGVVAHNIIEQDNLKSDTYTNGTTATQATSFERTGNWRIRHQVDCGPMYYLGPDFQTHSVAPAIGIGDVVHPRSVFAQTASSSEATISAIRTGLFTNPKAGSSGAGGGDYTWKTGLSSTLRIVAAGEARNKFDIAGNARWNDGTGYAGPYERP